MAIIESRQKDTMKINFLITGKLKEDFQKMTQYAEKLDVKVDFKNDFRKWFETQIKIAVSELKKLEQNRNSQK